MGAADWIAVNRGLLVQVEPLNNCFRVGMNQYFIWYQRDIGLRALPRCYEYQVRAHTNIYDQSHNWELKEQQISQQHIIG